MSQLASIRQRQQTWGRRALGLFVAVWLNLALQPCAMAYTAGDDHDCPHCPPAETHEHGGMHGNMDHKVPCADGLSDCAVAEDVNHDGRNGQSKLKDAPTDTTFAIASDELAAPYHHPVDATSLPRYASVHAGAPPPLHVLNCVYLD
ncbi:MAG: hypothetical protein OEU90_01855 [Gammaproteobacteria bacterium]|nr:hypothetical protein [Gammaproteobacteria bacterium]MDH3749156.1 hypothetical protein [Gammaproteobacteria bacterium]MDH3804194.1 hypothetical protein [Gammaproteobacteria bacterium]